MTSSISSPERRCASIGPISSPERRCRTRALLALAASATGCGGARLAGHPLRPGEVATAPAVAARQVATPATGVLAYEVAFARGGRLVSVELGTKFWLVVRALRGGTAREIRRVRLGDAAFDITGLAVGAAGRFAWVASADGTARAIDLDSGRTATTWPLGGRATAVAASPDGAYVATGLATGAICLRRVRDAALLQCVWAHRGPVSALAFSPAGPPRLASASWDGSVVLWQVPSLRVVAELGDRRSANDVAFSPDGAALAIARSRAPPIRTLAVERAERAGAYAAPDPDARIDVIDLATLLARGRRPLAPGSRPRRFHLPAAGGDAPPERAWRVLVGHHAPVTAIAWTPDGRDLMSASWDRTVRLWNVRRGVEVWRSRRFVHIVRDVAVAPSGALAAVAAWGTRPHAPAVALFQLRYPAPRRN